MLWLNSGGKEMKDIVEHIVKEGSREHVISWSNKGAECSEPNCEINEDKNER